MSPHRALFMNKHARRRGLACHPPVCRYWLLTAILLWLAWVGSVLAQQEATYFELAHKLPMTAKVLLIGAHPDDENNALLTFLSRGQFVRCAYLSATRGEGGQNLIGPELFDALGILRTEELLASRSYDHCEQFFTRAYDFGFSKDPREAFEKWGREEILGDMVWVIRRYRPDIVISIFTGGTADGHGHHQAVGILTPEAFAAAGDPKKFPEQLKQGLHPWQPQRLYVLARDGRNPNGISLDVGQFSPEMGKSLTELAAIGRSQNESQGEGTEQRRGPLPVYLERIGLRPADNPSAALVQADFLEILNAPLSGWGTLAGEDVARMPSLKTDLALIDSLALNIANASNGPLPSASVPFLAKGIQQLRLLRQQVLLSGIREEAKFSLAERLSSKEEDFSEALAAALGLSFEVKAGEPTVPAGGAVTVTASFLNRCRVKVEPLSIEAARRPDWRVEKTSGETRVLDYNESIQWKFSAEVAVDTPLTEMYWLQSPRVGDRYTIANQALLGRAENIPELSFVASYRLAGDSTQTIFQIERPLKYISVDPRYGQRTESIKIVPAVSVSVVPAQLVIPRSAGSITRTVFVRIENEESTKVDGTVKLLLPSGWYSTPMATAFSTTGKGEVAIKKFSLRIPANAAAGSTKILAVASVGTQHISRGFQKIVYPHIRPQLFYRSAETDVDVLDLKLPAGLKVGYVMGTGDRVPEALQAMGVTLTLLDEQALATASLSDYDAIVTGIRAYDVRQDLAQNNTRLLDYVKKGGTLIVQYNSASFGVNPSLLRRNAGNTPQGMNRFSLGPDSRKEMEELTGAQPEDKLLRFADPLKQFGPYPMLRGALTDRVVDETAPVKILAPKNPVFGFPNSVSEKDFEGWVQERGLYFMKAWDSRYTPLLASHDPGENDLPGGMLYAKYGEGNYVLTNYAWFRQLPAGVHGAYRIFANMISLSRVKGKLQ